MDHATPGRGLVKKKKIKTQSSIVPILTATELRECLGDPSGDPRQRNGKRKRMEVENEESEKRSRSTVWPRVIQNGTAGPEACTVSRTLSSRSGKSKPVHTTGI
jgi:hypothetical protein